MNLQQRLADDLKQALRDKDKSRLAVIRQVIAGIKNAEIASVGIAEKGTPLGDAGVVGVIVREVKRHRESIDSFKKGNRPDLVSREEAELRVLLEYLPQQMSHGEIIAAARRVIDEVGARGPRDKGKVMSHLMPQLKGKAEGQEVNEIVSELLVELTDS